MTNFIQINSLIIDSKAASLQKTLQSYNLKNKIDQVSISDLYTISKKLAKPDLVKIAQTLSNPITQEPCINTWQSPKKFDWVIRISFLPGVCDNVAQTAKESIEDLLRITFASHENVYTSQLVFITGKLSESDIWTLAKTQINPLIQKVEVKTASKFKKDQGMHMQVPIVVLNGNAKTTTVNLQVSDAELMRIGKEGIANPDGSRRGPLALDLLYLKTIQKYFQKKGRNPTDVELESLAQTWSEHCKHTIFADPIDEIKNGLFKTYIKGATEKIRKRKSANDICVSVFSDNSGAISFDQDYLITDKVETHNSPSALSPFGGAVTGIVGVNRDTIGFGLGAKPIINRYGFCFANPNDYVPIFRDPKRKQAMIHPKKIMEGVVSGVNAGGNCSGIPTTQGTIFFDKSYKGKPLVYVGTIGLIPKKRGKKLLHKKRAQSKDYIVMVGGRIGLDGIHGATFSSEKLSSTSPQTAVQIGDPITQKKLSDAIVKEARDKNLYNSITDNGAGGLSCSVSEMAKECGGCMVTLEKAPIKYPGLAPWQIWISESQERMTLAVPPDKWRRFNNLMKKRGVEATVIGKFTNSGKCIVKFKDKIVMDIDMDFLHNGLPPRPMQSIQIQKTYIEPHIPLKKNLTNTLKQMLSRPNIASFEFISCQYDHEVQGGSVLKPLQGKGRINADATVVKPILGSKKGVILSSGLYPTYSLIDTYHMAASCVDTAIRNAVAAGASIEKLALLDNFCWCSSDNPERLGQLKNATRACYDYAVAYGTPYISGKDSMFNDFSGFDEHGNKTDISILPTLLISSIGVVDDVAKVVSLDAKFPSDLVYILGETFDELGGSEYFRMCGQTQNKEYIGNIIPKVNALKNKRLYQSLYRAIDKELISASISIGCGGLAVALSKIAMGGKWGIDISLTSLPGETNRNDFALFSESQGRILVTINPKNRRGFESIFSNISCVQIGKITKAKRIVIRDKNGKPIVNLGIKQALLAYRATFKNY